MGATEIITIQVKKVRQRKTNIVMSLIMGSEIWHEGTYLPNRSRLTDEKQTCVCVIEEAGEEKDWEFGVSRYKLLYTGWIDEKFQLYIAQENICKNSNQHVERIWKNDRYMYV